MTDHTRSEDWAQLFEWVQLFEHAPQELPESSEALNPPRLRSIDVAMTIDHTLLKLEATRQQIDQLCEEAHKNNFKSVCVRLKWVKHAVEQLHGSSVVVACVIGFHEGIHKTSEKIQEATEAIKAGASELDMVLNYPKLKEKHYSEVYYDVASVRKAAPHPTILKVILETSQLSHDEILAGCKISQAASADFVKTSTGFNGRGATVEDVKLMKSVVGDTMKVKASGGVKSARDCMKMMEAGAERIGTSSGVVIMEEAESMDQGTSQNTSHLAVEDQSEY